MIWKITRRGELLLKNAKLTFSFNKQFKVGWLRLIYELKKIVGHQFLINTRLISIILQNLKIQWLVVDWSTQRTTWLITTSLALWVSYSWIIFLFTSKGSLISESFSFLFQSINYGRPKWMEWSLKGYIKLRGVIRYLLFGGLDQSGKLSEINSPLYSRSGFISFQYFIYSWRNSQEFVLIMGITTRFFRVRQCSGRNLASPDWYKRLKSVYFKNPVERSSVHSKLWSFRFILNNTSAE